MPSEGSGHQGRRQDAGTSGTDWMAGKRSDCYASAGWSVMLVPVSAGIRAADPALYSGTYHRGGKKDIRRVLMVSWNGKRQGRSLFFQAVSQLLENGCNPVQKKLS